MTNQEVWTQYKDYSQTTSDIARKIAFAGIAICWLFRDKNNDFPSLVMIALVFLLLFFLSDLLQYLITALLLRRWIRKEEIKMWENVGVIEGDYNKPTWIDTPTFSFFVSKLTFLIISFIFLGIWLFY
jgi:hypothetical protein